MTVLGKYHPAASARLYRANNNINLSVYVNDTLIRSEGIAHDGLERVFALFPRENTDWQRYDLSFTGVAYSRGGPPYDTFYLSLNINDAGVSVQDLQQEGVAFGLEVTGGSGGPQETLWLQNPGDNYTLPH